MDAFSPPTPPQEGLLGAAAPRGLSCQPPDSGTPDSAGQASSLAFVEHQREQLAEQLRAERRARRKDHELALQRIADDRQRIQALAQALPALPAMALQVEDGAPPSAGQCLLLIRFPKGDSVREPFPADSSLESVRQRLFSLRPELSPTFTLLQSFPKRHFSPADLLCPLQALGLAPSATLCVLEPGPASEGPAAPCRPAQAPSGEVVGQGLQPQHQLEEGDDNRAAFTQSGGLPLSLQPPEQRQQRAPGSLPRRTHPEPAPTRPHPWGRGWRLASEEPTEQDAPAPRSQEAPRQEQPRPGVSLAARDCAQGSPRPRHQCPPEEEPLGAAEGSSGGGSSSGSSLDRPLAVARAAEQRLQQAANLAPEGEERPPPSPSPPVPSLFRLALQGAVALLTAPSKQYRSSLASVTPMLAEHLLAHTIQQGLLRPRSLKLFVGCPLQKLSLDCYPYATNELLRQLWAFPSLCHLSLLACSAITDQSLSGLQHLSRLQHLNLSACTKLTDSCLQFLKGLPQLAFLALDQTRVSDRGLAEFLLSAPRPSLSHLSLNQTGITENTLHLLPRFAPHLRVLSVKQTGVTDVSALRQSEALRVLHLDDTCVSEASLLALSSQPALSVLTLSGVQSLDSNRALELVSGLPLAQLSLPSRQTLTDAGLASLGHLAGLTALDLSDSGHVTDMGLQHLQGLCRLRHLVLANTLVTDKGLCHVRGLRLLEELCLDRLAISSTGVAACIVCLPHLQVLSLASTPVGDTVARVGIARCKQLRKVNLSRTRLTDRGLRFLGQVPLVQLSLEGSGVTALGVATFLATCPTLRSIRSSHLRVLAPEDISDEEEPC